MPNLQLPLRTTSWGLLTVVCVMWVLSAAPAVAQQASHSKIRFDVHLNLGWYSDLGAGFRVDIPVVQDGLVDGVDDDLTVSPGAELLWFYDPDHDGFGIYPIVAAQWNFYLSERWSVFPELGAAFLFSPRRSRYWRTFVAPFLGVGARYAFSASNSLLFRVNWPAGLQVGVTF